MKIQITDYIRWTFTVGLIYFLWAGHDWAVYLTLTLSLIGSEIIVLSQRYTKMVGK